MTDTWSPAAPSEAYVPPQDVDAERAVLAAMLLGNEAIGRAIEMILGPIFYRAAHQKIFEAIVGLYNSNEKADFITVCEELRKRGDLEAVGGRSAIAQILESATTAVNLESHIKVVQRKATLRNLIDAARRTQEECFAGLDDSDVILDRAEERIFAITDARIRKTYMPVRDLLKSTFEHIQQLYERKVHVTGVPSGYDDLDNLTSGFQPGDLVIVAGRPSMGKSSLAVNFAENAAIRHKKPCLIFSLEMSVEQLALRLLCSQSEVALHKVRNGFLGNQDWPRLTTGAGLLTGAPIWIDDSAAPTVMEIRAKCRRLMSENGPDGLAMVIVDYLQMIRSMGGAENRVQEVSQITRALKALAKELRIPVIALSQLSRAVEQRGTERRPQLSDLRESGSIEQDADVVMFVYREEYYKPDDPSLKGKATIILAKQRNGPTADINLTFLREFTKFVPYSPVMVGETEPDF
jgi:replicative DNA helicase